MKKITLFCKCCCEKFDTDLKRYNYLYKKGRVSFYCSKLCFVNDKKSKEIRKICFFCKNEFNSTTHSNSSNFCSKTCSSKYSQKFVNNKSISKSLEKWWSIRNFVHLKKICVCCGISFSRRYRKCCSKICYDKMSANFGKKSAFIQSQSRRSKNESYFADLCKTTFKDVLTNQPIFNGWDADIILPDEKIAILWNGKWHYKKITKQHSVLQVQNRDKIKHDEIIKMGYNPYVVKDMGKFDKEFVEEEFEKFKEWLHSTMVV